MEILRRGEAREAQCILPQENWIDKTWGRPNNLALQTKWNRQSGIQKTTLIENLGQCPA